MTDPATSPGSLVGARWSHVVRLLLTSTGEIKERRYSGFERYEDGTEFEWSETSLELALGLVSDLVDAIEAARPSKDLEIIVKEVER